ncbi:MAG: ABC-type transport auxiliary lipoprotein component [Planctomycetota bacterium]
MMQRNAMLLCAGLALSSCSSVEVPRESWWRLDIPVAGLSANSRDACVLRVQDLQLGNAMSGDFLIIAHGPSKLEARELDRWVAPLDRLATDAFIVGLSRSGAFSLVKGAGDGGDEDLTLHGRITDFAEHRNDDGSRAAVAAFSLWVEGRDDVRFADEFRGVAPIEGQGASASVKALSLALQQVIDQVRARIVLQSLSTANPDAAPPQSR